MEDNIHKNSSNSFNNLLKKLDTEEQHNSSETYKLELIKHHKNYKSK